MKGPIFFDVNVEFEDIRFLRATSLAPGQTIEFTITIHIGTGRFEITEGATAVVTGFITEVPNPLPLTNLGSLPNSDFPIMKERDFYKELRLRGYHYSGAFRSVIEARGDGLYGKIKWDTNWISFMDCLLQICIVGKDSRSLILPTRIQKMRINAKEHMRMSAFLDPENPYFEVQMCPTLGVLIAGGIEISGFHTSPVARRKPPGIPVLEHYKFIPQIGNTKLSATDAVRVCVQLALENNPVLKVKAVEVDTTNKSPIIQLFETALGDLPLVTSDLMLLSSQNISLGKIHVEDGSLSTQRNCAFLIVHEFLDNPEKMEGYMLSLSETGYIVSRESSGLNLDNIQVPIDLQFVAAIPTADEYLFVFQRVKRKISEIPIIINVEHSNKGHYEWLEKLQSAIKENSVVLVSQKDQLSGIIGLVNCIRKEPNGNRLCCVLIQDPDAPPFNYENPFYNKQLRLGLAVNVLRNVRISIYLSYNTYSKYNYILGKMGYLSTH